MENKEDKLNAYLKKNWGKMEFTPSDEVWDQLAASLNEEQFDHVLRSSFDEFDESPSDTVLNRLESDLAESRALQSGFDQWEETSAVPGFESLKQELDNDLFDQSIRKSYQKWNGGNSRDLWEKLDEELSREAVWLRLQQSLNAYRHESTLWRILLAVAAMLLLFFRVSDESNVYRYTGNTVAKPQLAAKTEIPGNAPVIVPEVKNTPVYEAVSQSSGNNESNSEVLVFRTNGAQEPNVGNSSSENEAVEAPDAEVRPGVLPGLGIYTPGNTLAVHYPESRKSRFSHFSFEAGPQLTILTERSESSLSTFTPGMGFGANMNYRYATGPVTISHGIGYSTYNQQAGDYVNGRYRTGNQQMNAIQFSTVAGVGLKRFQFYGGFVLSRVLSGIERSGSTVTKVYHFDPVAPGLIAGVNMTLVDFRRSSLGTGVQYSWIRGLTDKENSLSNVQGIRLNLVYNF